MNVMNDMRYNAKMLHDGFSPNKTGLLLNFRIIVSRFKHLAVFILPALRFRDNFLVHVA